MQTYCKLLLKDGSEFEVTLEQAEDYRSLFPAVNVAQEFCCMEAWLKGNESRRKTKRGIKRFIANWLIRAAREQSTPSRIAAECAVGRNHYGA